MAIHDKTELNMDRYERPATPGNWPGRQRVCKIMGMRRIAIPLLFSAWLLANDSGYDSIKRKFDTIENERLPAGSRVELTPAELTAYAAKEAPPGVRNPHLQFGTPQVVTGSALIDFGKVERAQGRQPGWLMAKLLDGERPVSVTARIRSAHGTATVDVERVEVSGIAIDGRTLDFLIQNVLLPLYPNAVVGRPFELGHRIDRLDVGASNVVVAIGR
jgi:hypothetical protein